MKKFIVALMGKSGSGKSTVADRLYKKYGWKSVQSYTTRPKRYEGETGHTFITEEEFGRIPEGAIVAYTLFDGYRYCCTLGQIMGSRVYIIDPEGLKELRSRLSGKAEIVSVYLNAEESVLTERMLRRGDNVKKAEERILHDREAFMEAEALADITIDAASGDPGMIADAIYSEVRKELLTR